MSTKKQKIEKHIALAACSDELARLLIDGEEASNAQDAIDAMVEYILLHSHVCLLCLTPNSDEHQCEGEGND